MAITKVADVIQPELFAKYVIDRTTELSKIMYAGVIKNNPRLNELITGGGTILHMPSWNDLTGESEVLSESHDISVNKITAKAELATLLIRAGAWGAHELAGALAGDDPMKAIGELVANWWVRDEKKNILSILKGIFNITGDSSHVALDDHVLDLVGDVSASTSLTSAMKISGDAVLDAKQLMGDASGLLSMLYMHSATFTALQKQNMIQFIPTSESHITIPTYLGYRVVYDDSCPVETVGSSTTAFKKYTTYLLSEGCIERGVGKPVSLTEVETDRDSLGSTDYLINRQAKVLHPRGISWVGAGEIDDVTPSNAELANASATVGASNNNWSVVADPKKIGIVKLVHVL